MLELDQQTDVLGDFNIQLHLALAWAHLAYGKKAKARTEAQRARQLGEQLGGDWGQDDLEELIAAIESA